MKKILLFLTIFSMFNFIVYSQIDTKKVIIYNKVKVKNSSKIDISIKNAVSKFNFAKFKFTIKNGSKDFVLYKRNESIFKVAGKEYKPESKKTVLVYPKKRKSKTVKVVGCEEFLVDNYKFIPKGMYSFKKEGTVVKAPDFHMPATKNSFEAGNFEVNMIASEQKTKITQIRFECTYTGDKIGVVIPSNAVLKPEGGREWANVKSRKKIKILQPGESTKFTIAYKIPGKVVDMQFAQMDVLWKKTFAEAELKPINFKEIELVIDKQKTKKKNN